MFISACSSDSCFGDQFIRLFNADGLEVAQNDDGCDLCSAISYISPSDVGGCSKYTIRQGCFSSGSCGGQLQVAISNTTTWSYEVNYPTKRVPVKFLCRGAS